MIKDKVLYQFFFLKKKRYYYLEVVSVLLLMTEKVKKRKGEKSLPDARYQCFSFVVFV